MKKLIHNENVDGFIVGLQNYSVFFGCELSIKEIKDITDSGKKIFVAVNKVIYNSDIDDLKKKLTLLSKMDIEGILFEDLSVLNINNTLKLNLKLVWNQMHLATNYLTTNYYYKKGVKTTFLSPELRLEDYINIKSNTDSKIMVYLYGRMPMFYSSRTLITNYFKYINMNKIDDLYYLYEQERNKYYPIYEHNNETFILDDIINGIKEVRVLKENYIDYIVINGLLHDEETFDFIVDSYIKALNGENTYSLFGTVNTGFLYKETIYKVKS